MLRNTGHLAETEGPTLVLNAESLPNVRPTGILEKRPAGVGDRPGEASPTRTLATGMKSEASRNITVNQLFQSALPTSFALVEFPRFSGHLGCGDRDHAAKPVWASRA
jgi:hypothetical protein